MSSESMKQLVALLVVAFVLVVPTAAQTPDWTQVTTAKPTRNTDVRGDGWRTIGNWDRVKKGISFAQVTQVLGKPTKIDAGYNELGRKSISTPDWRPSSSRSIYKLITRRRQQ